MKGWRGPEYEGEFPTLGYEVIDWAYEFLPSPADEREQFTPTDEQYQIILHWYRIDPTSGRFIYRRGALERAKGWGKSPLAGVLALADFAGPALFDGWDADGEPVAKPWGRGDTPSSWVQIAANSEDQSENTYGSIYGLLSSRNGDIGDALGIDVGRKVGLYLKRDPKAKLEPVTASAGTREGQRVTFAILDETMLWTRQSGGLKLAATIRRNAAKMSGRTLETCNAPMLGLRSVAELTGMAAENGAAGIYYNAVRPAQTPQPDWTDEQMVEALRVAYGDSVWVDPHRLVKDIRDPDTDWSDALRFYFNVRSAGAGIAVDPRTWDDLARPDRPIPPTGTLIALGFDGSYSQDATCLVACTADGFSWPLGWWERDPSADKGWRIPRLEVQAAVEQAFERYQVGLMFADPWKWQTEIQSWADRWGDDRVIEFDTSQTKRHALALDRWRTAIAEGTHTHSGDPRLRAHVVAAHLEKARTNQTEDGRTLYRLVKGDDGRRIDGAVADVLALEAAATMEAPAITTRSYSDEEFEALFHYS